MSAITVPSKYSPYTRYLNIRLFIRKSFSPSMNSWFFETTHSIDSSKKNQRSKHSTEWLVPLWSKLCWKLSSHRVKQRANLFADEVFKNLKYTNELDITYIRNKLHKSGKTNLSLAALVSICIKNITSDKDQQALSSCILDIWHLINGRIIDAPTTPAQFMAMPIASVALVLLGRKVHCVFPNQSIINQEIEVYKKLTAIYDLKLDYDDKCEEGEGANESQQFDILLTTSSKLALNYLQADVVLDNRTSTLRSNLEKLKLSVKDNQKSCVNLDVALLYDANYSLIDHVVTPYSLVTNEENEDDRQVVSKVTARQYYNNYKQISGYSVCASNIQRYYTDLYSCNRVNICQENKISVITEGSDPDTLIKTIKKQLEKHDVVLHMSADMKIPENISGDIYPYITSDLHTDEIIGKLVRISSPGKIRSIETAIITGGIYEPRKLFQLLNWFKINKPETTLRYFSAEELKHRKIKIKHPSVLNKQLMHVLKKYQRQSDKERWMVIHSDNQIEAMLDFSVSSR